MNKLFKYFADAKEELWKFSFPKKHETSRSTWGVLVIIFLVSVYLFITDFVFSRVVRFFLP